jgi:3-deoxy-alpha-D-manno-octulosonate 8-oxidase
MDVGQEPSTGYVDELVSEIQNICKPNLPSLMVAIGGGITMDLAKAVSVCLTNSQNASEMQGWDKPAVAGITKIAVPTISGTGAEASRTAVLTNTQTGLKLGINSNFTKFDCVILDPDLIRTVPNNLFFFNAMDAYLHAVEVLDGHYRNSFSDYFAKSARKIVEDIFDSQDPRSESNHERLMMASYLAGLALTSSFVGLVHPLSAAIGVEYKIPHSLANLVALRGLQAYYPETHGRIFGWADNLGVTVPPLDEVWDAEPDATGLYSEMIKHELPVRNALGQNWRTDFTFEKFQLLLKEM